jgi:hypothetical protein
VKLTIRDLRKIVKSVLREAGGAASTKPMFGAINDPLSPATSDRESLGYLADNPRGVDPNDQLPAHLREPLETPEDCFGPVPPVGEDPYVMQDPLVRDASPLPGPRINR